MACIKEIVFSQGDTWPAIQAQLISAITGQAIIPVISSAVFKLVDENGDDVFEKSAVVVDQIEKKVEYSFADGETDTPGTYYGKFIASFSNGEKRSFPAKTGIKIIIEKF